MLFADILPHMLDGAVACKQRNFEQAIDIHMQLLTRLGVENYSYPAFNLVVGLSYLGNGDRQQARHYFELARRWAQRYDGLPSLVAAAFELSRLDSPNAAQSVHLDAVRAAGNQRGAIATGHAAIHVGVQYPSYGFRHGGRQLCRIGLSLLRPELGNREWAATSLYVGKLLVAQGVVAWLPDWLLQWRQVICVPLQIPQDSTCTRCGT